MRCCWGVHDALPQTVIDLMPRQLSHAFLSEQPITTDVVMAPEIDSLRRHWATIRHTNVAVIVFDAKVRLDAWRIPTLDMDKLLEQLRSQNSIKFKARNHIQALLNKTAKSFVSNFVTLSYKTRDPEKQAVLRSDVFGALWNGRREAYAKSVNKKSVELIALLVGEDAVVLEKALQEVRAGKSPGQVAKAHQIAVFDLNYVIKFMSK